MIEQLTQTLFHLYHRPVFQYASIFAVSKNAHTALCVGLDTQVNPHLLLHLLYVACSWHHGVRMVIAVVMPIQQVITDEVIHHVILNLVV